jgi:hypothetical protein
MVQQSEKIRENVKKVCNSIHCLALSITSIVSRVCRVRCLSCPGFDCPGFVCPGFVRVPIFCLDSVPGTALGFIEEHGESYRRFNFVLIFKNISVSDTRAVVATKAVGARARSARIMAPAPIKN